MAIRPIADGEPFSMNVVHEAAQLARDHPAALTDLHLRHWATLDPGGVKSIEDKRSKALSDLSRKAMTPTKAPPAVVATGLSEPLLDELATAIVLTIKTALTSRDTAITELKQKVAQLEAAPLPKYCGIHRDGETYVAGSLVTRKGGLWLSTDTTMLAPGTGSTWRLIVKEGRAQ